MTANLTEIAVVAEFTIKGEPASKARARWTPGHARPYTPTQTRTAERIVAWAFAASASGHKPKADTGYGVHCTFFAATRQRRDLDNMLKLICDALNGVAWVDDANVTEMSGRKVWVPDKAAARTEVVVYDLGPITAGPSVSCEECGQRVQTYKSTPRRRFCSTACRDSHAARGKERPCPGCGVTFRKPKARYCSAECATASRTRPVVCEHCGSTFTTPRCFAEREHAFCSTPCRVTYWREHRAAAARGTCSECGGPTSKKEYRRCRACLITSRGDGR